MRPRSLRHLGHLRRSAAVAAASALLLTGCEFDGAYDLPLPGSPVDADEAFTISAEFDDILNVVPRSPVYVDDVTVGEVTEVERVGWRAKVTMNIRDDVVLPENAIAEIRQVSLLGEKYVALEAPADEESRGRLEEGDKIPFDRTGRNPEVEEVLGALSFLLSGGGVAQLGTITEELNNVMSGRTDELKSLLGNLETFIGTLDDQKQDIITALDALNGLTATLNAERDVIQRALDVTGPAIEVLADQHDELIGMLRSLDRLGVVGTRVIRRSRDDVLDSLRALRPVVSNLTAAGDKLAPGLNLIVSFPFPKEASEIVLGDYANTSIRADIVLDNFLANLPENPLPIPGAPAPGPVAGCLKSTALTSAICERVLDSLQNLRQLAAICQRPAYKRNPVCRAVGDLNRTPDVDDGPGLPGLPGITGPGGLLGAGRAATPGQPSLTSLLGGGS